jgi:hypothetical protein
MRRGGSRWNHHALATANGLPDIGTRPDSICPTSTAYWPSPGIADRRRRPHPQDACPSPMTYPTTSEVNFFNLN